MNNSVNWSIVKMIDIFEIHGGYYNKKPPMSEKVTKNSLPFLGASDKNNGITGFVKKEDIYIWDKTGKRINKDIDKRIFKGNAIAVTNNGSVGNAYYMENDFTCSHDINVLYLKNHTLNKNIAMFLISCIERSAEGFSYSVKWRPKRMVKSNMTLPMRGNVPDWDYMENYIENKKQK